MTASERAARTRAADELCARAYAAAGGPDAAMALVAVGGYGRGELAPHSDLDVVLVHDEDVDPGAVAAQVWYPLWDSGVQLDHSVRSVPQMLEAAAADLRVASGLLDLRHVTGDPGLTLRVRATVLAQWRRRAREQLPAMEASARSRHELMGELAHVSVPDLKEAEGGLRDATALRALVATWLVDVPHSDLDTARLALLDVRDLVQEAAGRASDRIGPEAWGPLAAALGLPDERAAQKYVRELGRRITHLSRLAWRRVDGVLAAPPVAGRPRRPRLEPLAPGLAESSGEVVLDGRVRPADDPLLLLRAAALAAERAAVLSPPTAARLARECPPLPEPWPEEARQLFVRLLAAGPGLLEVWSTLEETEALDVLLPEWERIRLLPHASVIHRYTVDRHSVEACIEAAALIRGVSRPDVLMVAALLHDIGKGGTVEHSVAGEPIAREVAARMGFAADDVALIALLVRRHLLLAETATTRDPDDPATVAAVADRLGGTEAVALLTALTESDAKATSPKAWSSWRAGLIVDLARRTIAALEAGTTPPALPPPAPHVLDLPPAVDAGTVEVRVVRLAEASRVTMIAPDRVGLLADFAATLALQRAVVRAARVWAEDGLGVCVWDVARDDCDAALLRTTYEAIVGGRIDPARRYAASPPTSSVTSAAAGARLAPTVVVRPEASEASTVLEVRAADQPGVVYLVCAALADQGVAVRSAHLDTIGPQVLDVFYVQEAAGGVLSPARAIDVAGVVRDSLAGETTASSR